MPPDFALVLKAFSDWNVVTDLHGKIKANKTVGIVELTKGAKLAAEYKLGPVAAETDKDKHATILSEISDHFAKQIQAYVRRHNQQLISKEDVEASDDSLDSERTLVRARQNLTNVLIFLVLR